HLSDTQVLSLTITHTHTCTSAHLPIGHLHLLTDVLYPSLLHLHIHTHTHSHSNTHTHTHTHTHTQLQERKNGLCLVSRIPLPCIATKYFPPEGKCAERISAASKQNR